MKLINLTPKDIPIIKNGRIIDTLPGYKLPGPTQIIGEIITTEHQSVNDGFSIEINHVLHRTIDLPQPKKRTRYIVSHEVLLANPKRWDLLSVKQETFPIKNTVFIKLHL